MKVNDMTEEQQTLLMLRGVIASMPDDQQARIKAIAERLRKAVEAGGEEAQIALGLVGAELAAA